MADPHIAQHAETEHEHHGGNRLYLATWFALLLLTVVALGVELAGGGLPRGLAVALLLAVMIVKATFIVANFMHMRFEHVQLVWVAIVPLLMLAIMFFGMVGDFGGILAR